jgi:hypothetical protein
MLTAATCYAALKFWLPMGTAFGLVIKAYRSLTTGVTSWADKLLNNHLSHIQAATESTASLTKIAAETSAQLLREILIESRRAAVASSQVQRDLKEYQNKDADTQRDIVTALAVLKDRHQAPTT